MNQGFNYCGMPGKYKAYAKQAAHIGSMKQMANAWQSWWYILVF